MVEKIRDDVDMVLYWAGNAGMKLNFKEIEKTFGKETAERIKQEISW